MDFLQKYFEICALFLLLSERWDSLCHTTALFGNLPGFFFSMEKAGNRENVIHLHVTDVKASGCVVSVVARYHGNNPLTSSVVTGAVFLRLSGALTVYQAWLHEEFGKIVSSF